MTNCAPTIPANFEQIVSRVAGVQIPDEKTVVSLFSGCGGIDLGFFGGFGFIGKTYDRLLFRIVFANDISTSACVTYRKNIGDHIQQGDIEMMIEAISTSCDILIDGFPCQDVFFNGKRSAGLGGRTILYEKMIEAIRKTRPAAFVAENVKGLLVCDFGQRVLDDFALPGYTRLSGIQCAGVVGLR